MQATDLQERTGIDDGFDDRPHAIHLPPITGHRRHEKFFAAPGIVPAADPRWQAVYGGGQITEETPRALERFLLAVDFVVDRAVRSMDPAAAELFLGQLLARRRDDRRAGDEHLRLTAHQQRVVAGHHLRRAKTRDRTEAEAHDRHGREIAHHVLPAG